MNDNLFAALPPIPETIVIGGETLDITPLKVGELPSFARAVRPLAGKLTADPDWLRLLAEEGEAVILALAIACRRPPEWVSNLALDDAVRLAEAVFAANADFFICRVVPEITRASQRIGMVIHGGMPLPGSSGLGTAIPTS